MSFRGYFDVWFETMRVMKAQHKNGMASNEGILFEKVESCNTASIPEI